MCLLFVVLLCSVQVVRAQGSLNPTNSPTPSMHTLEEIYQPLLNAIEIALHSRSRRACVRTSWKAISYQFLSSWRHKGPFTPEAISIALTIESQC